MSLPLILITNDDGITAPGIQLLAKLAKEQGEVYIVAPDKPQSGMGHAITTQTPLFYEALPQYLPIKAFSVNGTPTDCVKLAFNKLLPRKPDLCLSGINHGANYSTNIFYSGTMAAAMESGLNKVMTAGFSLLDFNWDADFSHCQEVISLIIQKMINKIFSPETILNVNIPKGKLKGIQVCRQSNGTWQDIFVERQNPQGNPYFWYDSSFVNLEKNATDTDIKALKRGFVSVVPCMLDLTNHKEIPQMKTFLDDIFI